MFGERETWSRGALIPLRSPFVMGIRKKEHVIGIDRRSEPDHGFRKLAKPDIAWLLGFRKTQDSPHVFLLSLPSTNLAPYVVVAIIVVVIVTTLSTSTMHAGSNVHASFVHAAYSSFHIVQPRV